MYISEYVCTRMHVYAYMHAGVCGQTDRNGCAQLMHSQPPLRPDAQQVLRNSFMRLRNAQAMPWSGCSLDNNLLVVGGGSGGGSVSRFSASDSRQRRRTVVVAVASTVVVVVVVVE